MPFYKVPSANVTTATDPRRVRAPLSQTLQHQGNSSSSSPDHPSSRTDSSLSASSSSYFDEDGPLAANGGATAGALRPHKNNSHSSFSSSSSSHKGFSDMNGHRNLGIPEQQVSIVELEIQQQSEREAELHKLRRSLYSEPHQQPHQANGHRDSRSYEGIPPADIHFKNPTAQSPLSSGLPPPPPLPSSPPPFSVSSYDDSSSSSVQSHPGESLITREIKELQRREEELRRRRKETGHGRDVAVGNGRHQADIVPSPPVQFPVYHATNAFGNNRENVSSPEFGERNGANGEGNRDDRPRGRTTSRIQPLDEPEAAAVFTPQEEAPIERETRLAREREDALRISRGLPAVPWNSDSRQVAVVGARSNSGGHAMAVSASKDDQTMKKLASSRLMVEMEKEKQRELEVRRLSMQRQQQPQTTSPSDARSNGQHFEATRPTNMYHRKY